MSRFALVVFGKRVMANDGTVMAYTRQPFLVLEDLPDHWVEATSQRCTLDEVEELLKTRTDAKLFDSKDEAKKFAKKWRGHPWWCVPNGEALVLEMKPRYTRVLAGFKVKGEVHGTRS